MEKYKPSATFFFDDRVQKANGKYPLKLTVYYRPNKRRYRTGIDLTAEEWIKFNGKRLKDDNIKELKIKTNAILANAELVFSQLPNFTFPAFEKLCFNTVTAKVDMSLKHWFKEYGDLLESQGREGTRISYNTTFNSINSFKKDLELTDITKKFLQEYETYMTKAGKSSSTIGIYLRQLRAIINRAMESGILKQELYPFKGFQIPSARNVKKALSDEQLQRLLEYKPENENQSKALDFWIFSYLCNGMNFTDILHLRHESIIDGFMHFNREKTKRTKKKDLRPIKVALNPRAVSIISRWQGPVTTSGFIFPILEAGLTPKTTKNRIQKFIKQVNSEMDVIRKDLKFDNRVGTYVARHSFSSRLMRKGASTQFIKESLGHSSVASTENYLGDFSDNVKQEYNNILTDFS